MGRKAKATALKETDGSFKKNPQRRNKEEPKLPAGVPPMPVTIADDEIAREKWVETCGVLKEMRVITQADRVLIERMCLTYSHYRQALDDVRKNGLVMDSITQSGVKRVRNPAALELHACEADLHKQTSELGLTPSSRSRLKTTEREDEDDPFTELLSRIGRG